MANIYTKGGDKGQTSLIGGSRVSKGDLRVECYGTIDEVTSVLGMAYAASNRKFTRYVIRMIQEKLFNLSAELACDEQGIAQLSAILLQEEAVTELEKLIDLCTMVNGMQRSFVVPGENPASAALHLARTVARRAEREIVRLNESSPLRGEVIRYVNRLSDAIYAVARFEETLSQLNLREALATDMVLEAFWNNDTLSSD